MHLVRDVQGWPGAAVAEKRETIPVQWDANANSLCVKVPMVQHVCRPLVVVWHENPLGQVPVPTPHVWVVPESGLM